MSATKATLLKGINSSSTSPQPEENKNTPDYPPQPSPRTKFGARVLEEKDRIYEHNSWDNVEWDNEQVSKAKLIVESHSSLPKKTDKKYLVDPSILKTQELHKKWNRFYSNNQSNFFKDRNWYESEFPEFFSSEASNEKLHVLEVGCGSGSSVFPLLKGTENKTNVFISAFDFSQKAVELVQTDSRYNSSRCSAFVHDVSCQNPRLSECLVHKEPVDLVLMVFVLSSLKKETMRTAIRQISEVLRPGSLVFFRDYGLYDLAQLRFQPDQCLEGNQYIRGDGTLTYFFTREELEELFTSEGYVVKQLIEDRRLLVNRKRQLQMYRVWIQGRFIFQPCLSPN